MLRLLKYEFRKRIATLSVVLAILLLTQGWALFCLCTKEHADQMVLPFTFLIIFGFLGTVFLFFDGVSTFSSEFSDKKGYMMFLTPNSPGAIVGAKFLYAVITVVGGYSLFHLFAYWDYSLFINKWENVKEGTKVLEQIARAMFGMSLGNVTLYGMVFGIIRMLTLIAFGYLAVTISTTVLANHKYKVFLTIAVFVGVLVLVGVLTSAATNFLMETLTDQIGLSQSLETGMTALPEESNFFDILKVIEKTKMAEAMHVGMVIDVGFSVLQWAAAYFLSVVLVKKKVSL